jgi:hypothetical protein
MDASQTTSVTRVPLGTDQGRRIETAGTRETRSRAGEGGVERRRIGPPEVAERSLPKECTAARSTPLGLAVDPREDVIG